MALSSPMNSQGVIMPPKQWQQCGRPQQNRLSRPRRGRIRRISQSSSGTVSLCLPEPRWRCRFWMGTSYYRGGTCEVCGGVRHLQPGAQICFLTLCHEFFSEYLLDCLEILLEDKGPGGPMERPHGPDGVGQECDAGGLHR